MIVTYLRSSMAGSYELCNLRAYLEYTLNFRLPPNTQAAPIGTVIHKGMELLGLKQLAIQNNQLQFIEDEINKEFEVEKLTSDIAIQSSIDYYLAKGLLKQESVLDVLQYFNRTITDYPQYTPLGAKVKTVEKFFDIELPYDWARYEYEVNGQKIEGQLGLKGTVDLIFDISPDSIEVCDYKSGRSRTDWVTGKEKNSETLRDDFQLMLYYYALSKSYPEIKTIIMTLLFIRAGGPFSAMFTPDDLPRIELRIRTLFEKMKNNKKLSNIKYGYNSFKCKWCSFKTTNYTKSTSYCDFFSKELTQLGLDKVTNKYADPKAFGNYGEGGGKSDKTKTV